MRLQIKICGMRNRENIIDVASLKPDYMGFIFYPPSPRYLSTSIDFPSDALNSICKVGVFVNELEAVVLEKVRMFGLNAVQLHGNESPAVCERYKLLGLKVLKAVSVAVPDDFLLAKDYEGCVDLMVLDTKSADHGGSGRKFDWKLLKHYDAEIPFLLSGGINPADAGEIRKIEHPQLAGVDLNSRFEIEAGMKDVKRLGEFLLHLELHPE